LLPRLLGLFFGEEFDAILFNFLRLVFINVDIELILGLSKVEVVVLKIPVVSFRNLHGLSRP
jgi:hypothetical protein